MVRILRTFLRLIGRLAEKVVVPSIGGQYYYFTLGKTYIAPSRIQIKIFKRHHKTKWQSKEYEIVEKIIKASGHKRPVILDIGANVGYTAIAYSQILRNYHGRCISFEPALKNVLSFSKNTSNLTNVSLMSVGLGDRHEPITLGIPAYVRAGGIDIEDTGLLSAKLDKDVSSESFRSASLQLDSIFTSLCFSNENIVFMKIDVEGWECQVIRGALKTIEACHPTIQMEFNPRTNSAEEISEIFSKMSALGYHCYLDGNLSFERKAELYFIHSSNSNPLEFFGALKFSKMETLLS